MKILFVCTGNTCRSPLAEAYLKNERPSWKVGSAAVSAVPGSHASENASLVAIEEGLDLSGHRARALEAVCLEEFDQIYAMSATHLRGLPKGSGGVLLSSIVGERTPVKDPYGGSLSTYRLAFSEIKKYLQVLLSSQERN